MKSLIVKPIPIPSGADHPGPPSDILPRHEFSMGFIAPKGSGKTTALINLLHFYKGFFNTIIVFSPTVKNDEKWDWVKKQKLLVENTALKKWIQEMRNKQETQEGIVKRPVDVSFLDDMMPAEFDPRIPEDHFITEYDENTLGDIMDQQQLLIDTLKKFGKTKHIANRILIVFDDLLGSDLFSGKKKNPFKMLNANHRHYSTSLLMVTQAYKEIPKTVRTQFSCLIVFEIPNENEIKAIYEENPVGLKYPDWVQVYNYCVEGDHNFMFINYQVKKSMRIMKNLTEYVFFK